MSESPPSAQRKKVTTTRSTAGPGFDFEDLVAADLLSLFLLDMPIDGIDAPGERILSQAGASGWLIDDLVCVGREANGADRHLAISCKSNVQVTANGWPDEFIAAAWQLWRKGPPFDQSTDKIALVTRGRNASFDALWSDIKNWCANADATTAWNRIDQSAKHRRVFDSVRSPGIENDKLPSAEETIALVSAIEIYPADFQLSPSRSLADAKARCRSALISEELREADRLWMALIDAARAARLGNGIVRLSDLIRSLSTQFALKAHPSISASLGRLEALSADHRAGIEMSLPNGHAVSRVKESGVLAEALNQRTGCFVSGDSGSGKSALVRGLLDRDFADAMQIWLGPEELADSLSEARRSTLGLDHDLAFVLERTPKARKILVLDSLERLDSRYIPKLEGLVTRVDLDPSWLTIAIAQSGDVDDPFRQLGPIKNWPVLAVPGLANSEVREALNSAPALAWAATDQSVLPLLSNLKTLSWVMAASSSFSAGEGRAFASTAAIADRLFSRWTAGPAKTQLQRLLVRLAIRDAQFERSFPISELEAGDLAAFDQRPAELPLLVNSRNRIEFRHDLASDWARYQRLKEIADDIPQWAKLASQPLWIGAIRLLGQYLLAQPAQAQVGWDRAFQALTEAGDVQAADLMLDALCSDPHVDRHLNDRIELMFANEGALLKRLLHRFLHIATLPSIPPGVAIGEGLRIYLEADMRFPIIARWGPMGRFLDQHSARVGALGAPIVARLCKAWLDALPPTIEGDPAPLRQEMAKVALETARARQIDKAARRRYGGGDDDKLIFTTALAGAPDLPAEVAEFALEMAERRPLSQATQVKVNALRDADRAKAAEYAATLAPRRQRARSMTFISSEEDLPPWPLGPRNRLVGAFREAVLHNNGLKALMATDPATASEVLLACMIDDHPTREYGRSTLHDDLGLEFDQQSYPAIFWKSPFFLYLQIDPAAALKALKQLIDFTMQRSAAAAPDPAAIPAISLSLADGATRTFPGSGWHFGWSQQSSMESGQLFSAMDALERWLVLKADAEEDLARWCEQLLALEGSTAILGVLINIGKSRPTLFLDALRPLVAIETLYSWDHNRVANLGFDSFSWFRLGDTIMNMARDWILAPHRRIELRTVIAGLTRSDPEFAQSVLGAAALWTRPDDPKRQLEQRMLKSELDPSNWTSVTNEETGEVEMRLTYPLDLQSEIIAYQSAASTTLETLTLPYQLERVLSGTGELSDESADYLASLLPESGANLPTEADRLKICAAAAATLIGHGSDWCSKHPNALDRAEAVIRDIVARIDAGPGESDDYHLDEALKFAAVGALHAALKSQSPGAWNGALMTAITARDGVALAFVMALAERSRTNLGSAWYRLLLAIFLFAGLTRLFRYGGDESPLMWRRWRQSLCSMPLFGKPATIASVDALGISRRVERLLETRRARNHPDRPIRLHGKARRFAGLSTHTLARAFSWLLDPDRAEQSAHDPENRRLIAGLWAVEAWRMEGERDESDNDNDNDDDGEYDLPSDMGYSLLRIAAQFVMAEPANEPFPLWRAILSIGPNGHYAVEHFTSGWFLQLFNVVDADRFMTLWKDMLQFAFNEDWTKHRRWYRGRDMLTKLLGLQAPAEISSSLEVRSRLTELWPFYERWARDALAHDEDDIATFCHFLTREAGRILRLDGIVWLRDGLAKITSLHRDATGNAIAEAIDSLLSQHSGDLVERPDARDAMIDIVARLVREQVATAMGLQARIAALR